MSDATAAALAALNQTVKELIVTLQECNEIVKHIHEDSHRDYQDR